ncbi:hypothetical protein [Pediococcus pentosaceus]|uniref:hypothetical protein n=1 Tax=Pediococcus pentosaceus TaxID=1255 RepID=UPI00223C22EA|nr:hypothetical protein [Pediococcus pentosaceus]MCS8573780.1 hypothetical protein [Pediococcus pentosaceus]
MTKIIQCTAPTDIDSLGIKKGDNYYVVTHAKGVVGLEDFVNDLIPDVATTKADGLMSKDDKANLDKLMEPQEQLSMKSPDGSIFNISVDNDGKLQATKEVNDEKVKQN